MVMMDVVNTKVIHGEGEPGVSRKNLKNLKVCMFLFKNIS